jgi:mRNA interferase RelE/StbE
MYRIILSPTFRKSVKKFDSVRRKLIVKKIDFLRNNPDHPSLRTEKLEDDTWSSSVSMGIRLIWTLEKDTIYIEDVGKHDIYRKY